MKRLSEDVVSWGIHNFNCMYESSNTTESTVTMMEFFICKSLDFLRQNKCGNVTSIVWLSPLLTVDRYYLLFYESLSNNLSRALDDCIKVIYLVHCGHV